MRASHHSAPDLFHTCIRADTETGWMEGSPGVFHSTASALPLLYSNKVLNETSFEVLRYGTTYSGYLVCTFISTTCLNQIISRYELCLIFVQLINLRDILDRSARSYFFLQDVNLIYF